MYEDILKHEGICVMGAAVEEVRFSKYPADEGGDVVSFKDQDTVCSFTVVKRMGCCDVYVPRCFVDQLGNEKVAKILADFFGCNAYGVDFPEDWCQVRGGLNENSGSGLPEIQYSFVAANQQVFVGAYEGY